MKNNTKKLVLAALLSALVFVATFVIRIPMPLVGYLNLGDCFVLLCGWILGPVYGVLAAGIGSAIADVCAGWVTYAPATFVIKGLMAALAYYLGVKVATDKNGILMKICSAVAAEVLMVLGYLAFESLLYGFGTAAVNIGFNAIQGAVGLVAGLILVNVYKKFIEPMFK